MLNKHKLKINLLSVAALMIFSMQDIFSQLPPVRNPQSSQAVEEDFTWWYIMLFVLIVGLAVSVFWLLKGRNAEQNVTERKKKRKVKSALKNEKWNSGAEDNGSEVDAEKELEWLRKHSKAIGKTGSGKKPQSNLGQANKALKRNGKLKNGFGDKKEDEIVLFEDLPISTFTELSPAKKFDNLPLSNDQALVSAIEQTQDEYEEDQEVRELAIRILTAFRNQNSVEALSQVALYDLSSNLRSRAISVLAEFDHESTFETILLACADPTREVRAAAARALFTVTFDRGDAWKRIAETNDEYRMIQAARAAVESDLVDRSIDRLIHPDHKYAYEAFALIALLIKAGETEQLFDAMANHSDKQIKFAILHVLKIVKDERTLPPLYEYIEKNSLPKDLDSAANDVIKNLGLVTA